MGDFLREARTKQIALGEPLNEPIVERAQPEKPPSALPSNPPALCPHEEALCSAIALARLAATEAFQRASHRVLESFARDVLARELQLASADVAALVKTALKSLAAEEPVALLVSSDDLHRFSTCDVPLRADPSLVPGDLVVELRDGSIDARLNVRVLTALAHTTA
ncbi:MAG: hypothetical protein JO060_12400 [Candidatus Eremiobacteraeota bacterium]|nr:hypothetical protein [Candidatus Eremiobacteraeota bacterium]